MAKDFSKGDQLGHEDGKNGDNRLALRALQRIATNPSSWLPGAENRDNEFRRGYLTGFEDEVRRPHVITESVTNPNPTEKAMPETLGRGAFTDESRIEKTAKYATENGTASQSGQQTRNPAVDAVRANTQAAIASIHTSTASSSSMSNSVAQQIELLNDLIRFLALFQDRMGEVSDSYQRKVDSLHSESSLLDEVHTRTEQPLAETRGQIRRLIQQIGEYDIPAAKREIEKLHNFL